MNAHELRIGNLFIEENSKTIITVIGLEKDRIIYSGMFLDNWQAKPIPLTEEWLIKLGFEKKSWLTKGIVIECTYFQLNNFIVYLLKNSFEIELINKSGEQFNLCKNWDKEVHQLQNLYFALCGEELKF